MQDVIPRSPQCHEAPFEILHTIHSFGPCMACGVHLVDTRARDLTRIHIERGM